uniref:Endo/exonuclease/phosphatase domain-containing protein n=1 Tax=Haemonchus contortus TaxID=6289 RepID=A0A7I4XT25_HAECO
MAICTFRAWTLASEPYIEGLMMQARKIKYNIIVGDFNAKIGPSRTAEEHHIGTHGMESNEQGERLSEFIMSTRTIHGNSQFQKPSHSRCTWESPGGQFHNEVDHAIVNRKFCLADVAVVQKFYTESDRRLLRARFRFSLERDLRSSENGVPRLLSIGTTSLHWRVCGKIPSATTSMKNTTGSSNIFTIAPGELRVSKMSRNVSLRRLLS